MRETKELEEQPTEEKDQISLIRVCRSVLLPSAFHASHTDRRLHPYAWTRFILRHFLVILFQYCIWMYSRPYSGCILGSRGSRMDVNGTRIDPTLTRSILDKKLGILALQYKESVRFVVNQVAFGWEYSFENPFCFSILTP
jgi:hypothetical protein